MEKIFRNGLILQADEDGFVLRSSDGFILFDASTIADAQCKLKEEVL